MPMCVYMAGCAFGTEKPELRLALNLSVVVAGVLLASWGEQRQCSGKALESCLAVNDPELYRPSCYARPLWHMALVPPVCWITVVWPAVG
jgi:hypothetical protein